MNSDLFVITSVINTGSNPWSYTNQRSCFTKEERFQQTLQTIDSIRRLQDDSKIMLVECSLLTEQETATIQSKVDYFIQTYDDESIRHACINSHKKGYGEVKKLQRACNYIMNNGIVFRRLFKISARYFLNEWFQKDRYSVDLFTFKVYGAESGSTVLYSVPYSLFMNYYSQLQSCIQLYEIHHAIGLETLIPMMCMPRQEISQLGVSGQVAVLNDQGVSDFYMA
jgi:hypothetical protein